MFGLGMTELIVVGAIAVLLFGKKLPEVARTWGQYYRDARKYLADFQSTVNLSDTHAPPSSGGYAKSTARSYDYDDREEATAPRFEPPPAEPQAEKV